MPKATKTQSVGEIIDDLIDDSKLNLDDIPPEKKAVIYARKSIKTDSHSIDSQIDRGKIVLYEKGLILHNVYFDSESASKYTYDKRPGFSELMKDLESGSFKNIVVLKRDRLSKQFEELLQIKEKFIAYGIKVHYSATGEYQPSDDDTYSDFIENLIMAIGEYEAKVVKERTDTGKKIQREKGIYSPGKDIPFGFTNQIIDTCDQDYKLIPHEGEAVIVESIFKEYLRKEYEIADITEFALTKFEKDLKKLDRKLNCNKIQYMFTNPTYAGIQRPSKGSELFYKDDTSDIYQVNTKNMKPLTNVKPIVDQALWLQVALKYLNSKREYADRIKTYLFKNLLVCNNCGSNVVFSNGYYQCGKSNNDKSKDKENKKKENDKDQPLEEQCVRIKDRILINALLQKILEETFDEASINTLLNTKIFYMKSIEKNYKRVLSQTSNTKHDLLFEYIKSPNDETVKQNIKALILCEKKLREKIVDIQEKILSLENLTTPVANLRKLESLKKAMDFLNSPSNIKKAQELLTSIIEKVYIRGRTKKYKIENIDYGSRQNYSCISESIDENAD
jgi:DNA invertase Pin-like site-specific DNA recombinase